MTFPADKPGDRTDRRNSGGYARIATLASVAGLRSMLPLFATAVAARRDGADPRSQSQPYAVLRNRAALVGLGFAAAGELVGDKLPTAPSRLAPLPLTGRIVSGAIVGAVAARRTGLVTPVGAIVGTVAAVGGAWAGYHSRVVLGRATGLPDRLWAVVEDLIAIGLATGALASER